MSKVDYERSFRNIAENHVATFMTLGAGCEVKSKSQLNKKKNNNWVAEEKIQQAEKQK